MRLRGGSERGRAHSAGKPPRSISVETGAVCVHGKLLIGKGSSADGSRSPSISVRSGRTPASPTPP